MDNLTIVSTNMMYKRNDLQKIESIYKYSFGKCLKQLLDGCLPEMFSLLLEPHISLQTMQLGIAFSDITNYSLWNWKVFIFPTCIPIWPWSCWFFYSNILHLLYLLLNLFLLLLLIYLLGMSLLNYLQDIYRFRYHRNNRYSLLYLFLLLHVLFICT